MALNYVTLVCDLYDGGGNFLTAGTASFVPTTVVTDPTDHEIVTLVPIEASFVVTGVPTVRLLATDNANLTPAGWGWTCTPPLGSGMASFTFFLPFTGGSTQYLSAQAPTSSAVSMQAYLPIKYPPGAVNGYVWTTDGSGDGSWEPSSGGLTGITAADTSIVVAGTPTVPTVRTNTLDVIAADHPPAANWSNNSHKITALANGTSSTDAAAFGQIPVIDPTAGDIQPSPATQAAGATGKTADAGHVHPQPPMLAPTGLTGATAASRYAGATTTGAPVTGTFVTGDYVVAQNGVVWVCVTGGTPGTWVQSPSMPWVFDVQRDYGCIGDGQTVPDGAVTAGTNPVLTTVGVAAPVAPTVANSTSGGTVLAGTYQVEVTYVNAYGETTVSAATSTTTTGSVSIITITAPLPSGNATGWYAYVTQAGGSSFTRQQTVGSPTPIGQTLVLTAPPTSSGAGVPGANTTPSNPFKAGDVGKKIIVNGALTVTSAAVLTIGTFNNAGSVTLTGTTVVTVTGAFIFWHTDDTAKYQNAINAAAAYAAQTGYAQVFQPRSVNGQYYGIDGPLITSGTYALGAAGISCNSQLVIPYFSPITPQPTLHFKAWAPSGMMMWTTQMPMPWNAIVSTGLFASTGAMSTSYTQNGDSGVLGALPSITGGAGSQLPEIGGLVQFNNVHVYCENMTVVTPQSTNAIHYGGIVLSTCAKGTMYRCTAISTYDYLTASGPNSRPSSSALQGGFSTGLKLPGDGNNAVTNAYECQVVGYTWAGSLGEQGVATDWLIVGCGWGFKLLGSDPTASQHLCRIKASVQECFGVLYLAGTPEAAGYFIDADLDLEQIQGSTSSFLADLSTSGAASALLYGEVRTYGAYLNTILEPKWPISFRINSKGSNSNPGWVFGYTGFSAAGSGVAIQNPYFRDVDVIITGGTVTAISAGVTIGGTGGSATTAPAMTATGLTSGTVKWPSAGWLSITQSGNPTVNVCIPG